MTIKDVEGNTIKVTNLRLAIRQCKRGLDSPFLLESGYSFMLRQLEDLKDELTD